MRTEPDFHSYCTACRLVLLSQGYLRYKTITSGNVSSEAQVKIFFILYKNCFVVKILQEIKVFISLTIP